MCSLANLRLPDGRELLRGDRLEPFDGLPDADLFDSVTSFPVLVLLWRTTLETLARHRNPLFSEACKMVNPAFAPTGLQRIADSANP